MFKIIYLILFRILVELEIINELDYIFKFRSFYCQTNSRLFTCYLINLLFSYI